MIIRSHCLQLHRGSHVESPLKNAGEAQEVFGFMDKGLGFRV